MTIFACLPSNFATNLKFFFVSFKKSFGRILRAIGKCNEKITKTTKKMSSS